MKRFVWKLSLLILAAILTLSCISCGKGKGGGNEAPSVGDASNGDIAGDDSEIPLELVRNGKSDYVIYYPEECGETVWASANRLASAFENYTGAKIRSTGDLLRPGVQSDPNALEILVGKTNRPESEEAYASLGVDEYIVRVSGKKLVICGCGDSATDSAVDWFINTYFRKNSALSYGETAGSLQFSPKDTYYHEVARLIKSIRIGGKDISSFRIVVPQNGYAERYIALLLQLHIADYQGSRLEIVTDASPASEGEIRIGKTARTSVQAENGNYRIAVSSGCLEAVSNSVAGYAEIIQMLRNSVFPFSQAEIDLKAGDEWSGADQAAQNIQNPSDLRIMYHNVWGYLNVEKDNPVANRAELALSVYMEYQPDVLCWQEASGNFRSNAAPLMNWLQKEYGEICFGDQGGTGNPIFYKKSVFEQVESGYERSRSGDKGTTWVVLRCKETGKLIAVTNSHFAANTNAGGDPALGDEYRVQDAGGVVSATQKILAKYHGIDVFSGGDFNSNPSTRAYKTLTDAGYRNVRELAAKACTITPYNGSFTDKYMPESGIYKLNSLQNTEDSAVWAIDHIMLYGAPGSVVLNEYDVITDRIACTASDHLPHFINASWT